MNHNYSLVKAILENAAAFKWQVQGLGMMRMYLSKEIRLHIWDSRLQVENVTLIHDHPWHFHSTVVAGVLTNERWWIYSDKAMRALAESGIPYMRQLLLCGPGGCTEEEPERVLLVRQRDNCYAPGATSVDVDYEQHKDVAHSTSAKDGTVTLVRRDFEGDPDRAHVYFKEGSSFVSAEPRLATPEEISAVVSGSLQKWFEGENVNGK